MISRTNALTHICLITCWLALIPSCKKSDEASKNASPASSKPVWVDPNKWEPDPALPKPEITASIVILKEPLKKKISFKVVAQEANGMTVQEVQLLIKYRELDEQTKEWVYPEGKQVHKMIPFIDKGKGLFQTPIVEKALRPLAETHTDDNWTVEVLMYGPYWK